VKGLLNPESKPKNEPAAAPVVDPNVREAQEMLQRRLGLKVHIEDKKGKGRVVIEYSGVDDFDAILAALGE
jgi:ParB family chromosome partitioning protein